MSKIPIPDSPESIRREQETAPITIKIKRIGRILGLKRRAVYYRIERDPEFPKPEVTRMRSRKWRLDEIVAYSKKGRMKGQLIIKRGK